VRADAEGLFVPASDLPDAELGDVVVVRGHEGGEERTGTIVATDERDAERFFRLSLDH
jgi:transcription elongation GreA/GreB family factor